MNKLSIRTLDYYAALKKEETSTHITKWKEPISKGHVLHESNFTTLWRKQKVVIHIWGRGMKRQSTVPGSSGL